MLFFLEFLVCLGWKFWKANSQAVIIMTPAANSATTSETSKWFWCWGWRLLSLGTPAGVLFCYASLVVTRQRANPLASRLWVWSTEYELGWHHSLFKDHRCNFSSVSGKEHQAEANQLPGGVLQEMGRVCFKTGCSLWDSSGGCSDIHCMWRHLGEPCCEQTTRVGWTWLPATCQGAALAQSPLTRGAAPKGVWSCMVTLLLSLEEDELHVHAAEPAGVQAFLFSG